MIALRKKQKTLLVVLLVLLYIATGFFREFVFLNVNEQSRVSYYNDTDSHVAPSMQWLSHFSYTTLYYAKWPLTLAFTILFAALAAMIMRVAFCEKKFVRVTWIIYGATFVTGALFFLAGALAGDTAATYDISRFLAGLVETPAMLAILGATFIFIRRR